MPEQPAKTEPRAKPEPPAKPARPAAGKSATVAGLEREAKTATVPLIAAALIGGIAALAAAVGLDRIGAIDLGSAEPPQSQALADLKAQLDATTGSIGTLRGDLEAQIAEIGTAGGDTEAIQAQIDGLKAEIARLSGAAEPDIAPLLSPLEKRLSDLENAIAGGAGGREAALETLETRLSDGLAEIGALQEAVSAAAGRSDALKADLGASEKREAERIAGLEEKIAGLQETVAAAQAKAEGAASSASVKDAVEASQAASRKAEQAVAIAPVLAAESLQRAIDAGQPFEAALDAFRNLGVDDPALAVLRPYAADGLPTLAGLRAEFEELAQSFATAAGEPEEEAGAVDRLLKGAFSVVKVRPLEPQDGDGSLAIRSRVTRALAAGDLTGALAEWQSLPDDQKAATKAWADKARAVETAGQFAATVRTNALARLNMTQ